MPRDRPPRLVPRRQIAQVEPGTKQPSKVCLEEDGHREGLLYPRSLGGFREDPEWRGEKVHDQNVHALLDQTDGLGNEFTKPDFTILIPRGHDLEDGNDPPIAMPNRDAIGFSCVTFLFTLNDIFRPKR